MAQPGWETFLEAVNQARQTGPPADVPGLLIEIRDMLRQLLESPRLLGVPLPTPGPAPFRQDWVPHPARPPYLPARPLVTSGTHTGNVSGTVWS